jgi:hypothetical protein
MVEQPSTYMTNDNIPNQHLWVRLPKNKERCPYTGLSRSTLCLLATPMRRNHNQPPVLSKAVLANGSKRGIRLIHLPSLLAYIEKQSSFAPKDETKQEEGGNKNAKANTEITNEN